MYYLCKDVFHSCSLNDQSFHKCTQKQSASWNKGLNRNSTRQISKDEAILSVSLAFLVSMSNCIPNLNLAIKTITIFILHTYPNK